MSAVAPGYHGEIRISALMNDVYTLYGLLPHGITKELVEQIVQVR